jgi:hypothetical protein
MTRMRPYEVSNAYRPAGGVSEIGNRKKYRERRASRRTRLVAALARVRVTLELARILGECGCDLVCHGCVSRGLRCPRFGTAHRAVATPTGWPAFLANAATRFDFQCVRPVPASRRASPAWGCSPASRTTARRWSPFHPVARAHGGGSRQRFPLVLPHPFRAAAREAVCG